MEEKYQKRVLEIDNRIEALQTNKTMWLKAGGRGVKMASQAIKEIEDLKKEK